MRTSFTRIQSLTSSNKTISLANNFNFLTFSLQPLLIQINCIFQFSRQDTMSGTKVPRFMETLKEASKPALKKLIQVLRPFGLPNPSITGQHKPHNYDLSLIKKNLFSSEAKERRQKVLDHDIAHSPLYESKSFNNVGGKIFTPPISYFKKEKSMFFPQIVGDTLVLKDKQLSDSMKLKVNIIRIYSTISGDQVSKTYFEEPELKNGSKNYLTDGYEDFRKRFPKTQIIDINMPDSWLKKAIINLSKLKISKQIPSERHNLYFILPYDAFLIETRKALLCDNACSGYIYLVDQDYRLRWATSGSATPEEYALMWKCVAGLEAELLKRNLV